MFYCLTYVLPNVKVTKMLTLNSHILLKYNLFKKNLKTLFIRYLLLGVFSFFFYLFVFFISISLILSIEVTYFSILILKLRPINYS